jgi:alpha-L-arabinofuranosidase
VKYWEIGNENWHNNTGTPSELAEIVCEFSRAMKEVDPTIKIGASGNTKEWWKEFLPKASEFIDFLTVSQYSCMNWKSYDYYVQNPEINLIETASIAIKAIEAYACEHKDRLKVVICELNSMDYSIDGWRPDNNPGHALVTFEIIGQLLKHPAIEYGMIWNTRWINEKEPDVLWYALDTRNELLPPGRVLSIWGQFLSDRLVDITRTDEVVTFASLDSSTGKLNLFLVNKSYRKTKNSIVIKGINYSKGSVHRFTGTGPEDKYPSWAYSSDITLQGNLVEEIILPPTSITVIQLQ